MTGTTRLLRAVAGNHGSLHPRLWPGTVGGINAAVEGEPHHRDEFTLPKLLRDTPTVGVCAEGFEHQSGFHCRDDGRSAKHVRT